MNWLTKARLQYLYGTLVQFLSNSPKYCDSVSLYRGFRKGQVQKEKTQPKGVDRLVLLHRRNYPLK